MTNAEEIKKRLDEIESELNSDVYIAIHGDSRQWLITQLREALEREQAIEAMNEDTVIYKLEKDRDYYKKAKTENDERFQLESGELRRERDDYREALEIVRNNGAKTTDDKWNVIREVLAKYPMHDAKNKLDKT